VLIGGVPAFGNRAIRFGGIFIPQVSPAGWLDLQATEQNPEPD